MPTFISRNYSFATMPKVSDEALIINKPGSREIRLEFSALRKTLLVLRAVNHPLRKQILELLSKTEKMIVTDLHSQMHLEQSIVSQHLAVLRKAGVVLTNRSGKFIYYRINPDRLNDIKTLAESIALKN